MCYNQWCKKRRTIKKKKKKRKITKKKNEKALLLALLSNTDCGVLKEYFFSNYVVELYYIKDLRRIWRLPLNKF